MKEHFDAGSIVTLKRRRREGIPVEVIAVVGFQQGLGPIIVVAEVVEHLEGRGWRTGGRPGDVLRRRHVQDVDAVKGQRIGFAPGH
jgi:hypothetical protein